ncbi:FeMo cofactor biosynthesis protein NifB [Rhodovastum atsumiense]|uniref:FeMo cofactor biosynthesis protein NifB n=1 Tax=Rhodovastum atsumiense TaxID=504468 RepID=A0A5M6IZA4_9PROT|nr:nitrogenase cofactor biosynthesis protein NifB [Rhodovastum atsumiense]KAA5613633.1 nitrogenase cofactor biosynthesis protein NifB [Rhodovastum atsumiense]CAH2599538.1 FeMo cofactor biosynthesis protein NifB [Rhodovastum atsumiense]
MAQLITLDSLLAPGSAEATPAGGCASSACGSSAGPADLPPEVWEKVKDHPCYAEEAHHYFARMHVAVAPACNIQCHYCNRKYDCANESRPGVVSERLTPEQALRKVVAVASEVPQLSVLGIAGPGDAVYDWRHTKATFDQVREAIPDLRLCLSTNGLALPDHVDEIAAMGIDHVTITINMVDPEIGAKIYPWIFFNHQRLTGIEASRVLHERQMLGLDMLVARGVLVKVNSVMIPGINDEHLVEVNRVVTAKGAFLHNVMPLISDPAHGTHFGLTGQRGPSAAELKALQDKLQGGAKLMRHCRQCRADAVGLLGEDRGQEFTLDRLPEEVSYDPAQRSAYRAFVAETRGEHAAHREAAQEEVAAVEAPSVLVAVATKGGGRINQHFGHANEFLVFEVSSAGITFTGHRRVEKYCQGGWGEDATLDSVIAALEGVSCVLVAKIGDCPKQSLAEAGIEAVQDHAYDWIESGIAAWYAARHATAVRRIA